MMKSLYAPKGLTEGHLTAVDLFLLRNTHNVNLAFSFSWQRKVLQSAM